MTPLSLGLYVWLAGMPIAGLILLRMFRTEPTEKNTPGPATLKKARERWDETTREEDSAVSILAAIFWPGTLVFMLLVAIVGVVLFRQVSRLVEDAQRAGYKPEMYQGRVLLRCVECRAISGHHQPACSRWMGEPT